ncbi:hypothetical protein CsSME_00018301 [Camellia sinensis var. sinensis]
MAKRRAMQALITETTSIPDSGVQTETTPAGQTIDAVVALPTAQASSSQPNKRVRTSSTEPRLVDEDNTLPPQTTPPSPEPEHSDRANSLERAPKLTYRNRAIKNTNSVVVDKDHTLAFNLARSVCLRFDMEHHDHLTELKAIWSATKSMVLAMQKNHVAHKCVLELRKTTRLAVTEANSKTTKLNEAKQKMAELESEVAQLTGLVNSAEADKQKALAKWKDKYLRELAKLGKKKDAEIAELKKSANDAENRGYKEGEATYILQWEAAKDIFFKCAWKAAVSKLGYGQETKVFQNSPPHFILSYMGDYANTI